MEVRKEGQNIWAGEVPEFFEECWPKPIRPRAGVRIHVMERKDGFSLVKRLNKAGRLVRVERVRSKKIRKVKGGVNGPRGVHVNTPRKIVRWLNVNDFKSWMAADV